MNKSSQQEQLEETQYQVETHLHQLRANKSETEKYLRETKKELVKGIYGLLDAEKIVTLKNKIKGYEEGLETLNELITMYEEFDVELKKKMKV